MLHKPWFIGIMNLSKAIEIACRAHEGEVDKGGQPYILHPIRLMLKMKNDEARIVAVLHDVVEDSNFTLSDLREHGFGQAILEAVDCLTKKNGETYELFIERISENRLAKKVKIEDIKDNLDLTRLDEVTEKDILRLCKYHKALITLSAEK